MPTFTAHKLPLAFDAGDDTTLVVGENFALLLDNRGWVIETGSVLSDSAGNPISAEVFTDNDCYVVHF
jgi:hypothetical protein